ncbi:MAG: hypothetical protein B7Z27_03725, partial [Sphingobacteriia bacterium 32-37-4]
PTEATTIAQANIQRLAPLKLVLRTTLSNTLAFLTKQFSNNEVASLQNKLAQYKLPNTRLVILQDSIIANPSSVNEIGYMLSVQKELEKRSLNQEMVFKEMAILFPEIVPVSMGNHDYYLGTDSSKQVTVLLYQNNSSLDTTNAAKLTAWLQQKLQKQHIELIRK